MKNKIIIFLVLASFSGFSQITRTLSNVTNTADSMKPVSVAQKAAIVQRLQTVSTISALQAFTDATVATFDGSQWNKKSGNVASNGGAYAGTIINVSSTVYWERKWNNYVSAEWFGVNVSNTDNSPLIQNAINYLYLRNGGCLTFEAGIFKIVGTIIMKSYVSILGVYGETPNSGITANGGTIFSWMGASTGTIFQCFDIRQCTFSGFCINGNGGVSTTAINYDSDNNPSSAECIFEKFSIRECFVGVQWGNSGVTPGYASQAEFKTFTIWSAVANSVGFVINSGNVGQQSLIQHGGIQTQGIGIDIVVANLLQINRVFGGGTMATAFIRASTAIDVLIEGCSSEAWGTGKSWRTNGTYFLKVIAPATGFPIIESTITLVQNQINNPILVTYPVRISSTGDAWGYCKDFTTNVDISAIGTFTSGNSRVVAINNGINPNSIDLTTNMPTMGWIDSPYVSLINLNGGFGWVTQAYDVNNYYANNSMTLLVENTDSETFAFNLFHKTMSVVWKINTATVAGTVSNELRIKIPIGKIATKTIHSTCWVSDQVGRFLAVCSVNQGESFIRIQKVDFSNFLANPNGTGMAGQINFEIN